MSDQNTPQPSYQGLPPDAKVGSASSTVGPAQPLSDFGCSNENYLAETVSIDFKSACGNCRWWKKPEVDIQGEEEIGRCIRFPPSYWIHAAAVFPLTRQTDLCGEWSFGRKQDA